MNQKKNKNLFYLSILMCLTSILVGCGSETKSDVTQENVEVKTSVSEETAEVKTSVLEETAEVKMSVSEETIEEKHMEQTSFINGYETFEAFRKRHTGSVGLITDKTLLVSVYLNEPGYTWTQEDIDYTKKLMQIGYQYIENELQTYQVQTNLKYDTDIYTDLFYTIDIEESIPAYVTTEQERALDRKVDEWIAQIPVEELMQKYQAEGIGFLFFIGHEGCSYSSMHFVDDGEETWDESCMLYLRDLYSKTLNYETPAVYAHELLHLFGAEDLYEEAGVFSKDTYRYALENYPDDLMIYTFETIGGKYVTYPDKVVQRISPLTAYLIGASTDETVVDACDELKKQEVGCFQGSTYDRPF